MPKRPSLAETLRQAVTSPNPPPPETPKRTVAPPLARRTTSGFYAATRAGKKKVTAAISPEAHKLLRQLSLDHDKTTEALLVEALHDLFSKYGKTPPP